MSGLTYETPKNVNYTATVFALKNFVDLPNCDNVKHALVFGNLVIVAKEAKEGDLGLFFPVETQLDKEFLHQNSLYRKSEWGNLDPEKSGFFEEKGRVKAVKFRGHKSEGFWIPIEALSYTGIDLTLLQVNDVFDVLNGHSICKKYIPRGERTSKEPGQQKGKQPRLEDSIVDGQFRFHFDTAQLRKNVWKINPEDWVSITDKWHGTSVVIGKLLVKKELTWFEKLLQKFKVNIVDTTYGLTYSSRRVIKAVNGQTKEANHFYTEDIWGIVAKEVEDKIIDGFTLYGEIVGFTPDSSPIQGGYHYGSKSGEHKFLVYRITSTNLSGQTLELTWPQVQEYCDKFGLETVPTFWYGKAKDMFPMISPTAHWHEEFLRLLEQTYATDNMCPHNNNKVPAEGIVLRVERLNECEAFKLKNFRFLQQESINNDKEIIDLETQQSEETQDEQ